MPRPLGSKNKSANGDRVGDTRAATTLVLSLIRRLNEAKTRIQSISGELGSEIKSAVEDKHLHAGALKLVAKCARMDELNRVAFLAAFDLYRTYAEKSNLFGEEHVGDLVSNAEVGDGEAPPLGDVAGEDVERLRHGMTGAWPHDEKLTRNTKCRH